MKITDFLSNLKTAHRLIRMTVVGDGAVGKTTLVQALLKKTKQNNHNNSNGTFLEEKITRTPFMEIESWTYKDLVFQCYDLAGQREPGLHPLDLLKNQVLKYIDIFMFVFALDRYESFKNLNSWLQLMNMEYNLKENNTGFILVGNKVDLERNVSKDLVMTLVGEDRYFHTYIETSSIYGVGVSEVLDKIVIMGRKLLNFND
ncbi:MAG: GTPase domain-containing protein [Promethearchaeota archaeon]|nr:MAG: GTPase domain-containing protein [Candidatus Lokiarchaeota archaeon]